MTPDTTNQAIADALRKLIQAKHGGGGGWGPAIPEDPRLKKPKPNNPGDPGKNPGDPGKNPGDPGKNPGDPFDPDDLFDDDDDDNWRNPNAPKGPKIGDRGNKEIQDAEEAERQANAYKDEEGEKGRHAEDSNVSAEQARLERIQQSLGDFETQQKAFGENERAILDSQQKVAERRKRKQYRELTNDPALRFLDSVKCFIRDQVAYLRTPSWKRFSKRSVEATPLILRGKARTYNQKIPVINVYFDHSGSWGEEDIAAGRQAVKALAQYERKGEIKINIKYFADNVHNNPAAARREGGTSACQKILDDIKATHCNNVIIMTDGDMNWRGAFNTPVTVDGAVWFVFRRAPCTELTKYLRGKQLTKQYLLK